MRRKFSKESIFSYCNVDYDFFNEQILENLIDTYCWSKVYVILNHWYNWLSPLIKKCIPKRTKHRSSLPPWVSQLTSNLIKRLHTAQKIYTESHPKVLHLIKQTKTNAEMDKADYEQSPALEKSMGKLFKYFKAFYNSSLPSILKYKNETADTDPLKVELISKFFGVVYIESCTFSEPDSNTALDIISFTELEIREICQSLNTNKSKGPDDLPPVLFIKTQASLSHSIYQIFSKIIQNRRFPEYWKAAIISPIHKKTIK